MMSEEPPLSRAEVARRLGMSVHTIDRLLACGELKGQRRGWRVVVPAAEVRRYIDSLPFKTPRQGGPTR